MEKEENKTGGKAPREKTDLKFILGMMILVAVLAFIAGNFWRVVIHQAELDKEAERLEQQKAISAIVLQYGEYLKRTVFVDLDTLDLFYADPPKEGIYNRNGVLIRGDVLEYGDKVRIYGVDRSSERVSSPSVIDPGQEGDKAGLPVYTGITRMERISRATLQEADQYQSIVDEKFR